MRPSSVNPAINTGEPGLNGRSDETFHGAAVTSAPVSEPNEAEVDSDTIVSFIIPALNEEKHIGRCIQSIRQLILPSGVEELEIVVVDNQSADDTAEISRRLGARVIEVVPGRPSVARNAGAQAARGQWLAFVDADCELARDWLKRCAAELNGSGETVAVGGAAAPPTRDATWVTRAWYYLAHSSRDAKAHQVRWLPTFNLLVRRDAFEQAGGFDETLSTCEDCALGFKLAALGKLIHDPGVHTVHLGESRSLTELFRREAWRTAGNLRLAATRPCDVSNWLSLLLPPCLVFTFLLSIVGAMASLMGLPLWPPLAVLTFVVVVTLALVIRKTASLNPFSLLQQLVVYATYLAGRTFGLFWSFRRVERK
jgi:GT2 family glycosyltransferase